MAEQTNAEIRFRRERIHMFKKIMFVIFLVLIPASVFASEEVVKIDTRPGVTLNLLLVSPEAQTDKALIMFPGATGYNQFSSDNGVISKGNNFLVRTAPDFAKKGFLVAVVDCPSDQRGMDDNFRTSKEHLQDITKVVEYLTSKGYKSIYLVGTSRGTISAAYLGAELKNDNIKGVILTSTMNYNKFLRWIPLEKTPYPVLLVHHLQDECRQTPFSDSERMVKVFKHSPKVNFESVTGGELPQSGPCEPLSAHGYFGIENKAIDVIVNWISNTP